MTTQEAVITLLNIRDIYDLSNLLQTDIPDEQYVAITMCSEALDPSTADPSKELGQYQMGIQKAIRILEGMRVKYTVRLLADPNESSECFEAFGMGIKALKRMA